MNAPHPHRDDWIARFGAAVVEGREAFDNRYDNPLGFVINFLLGRKLSEHPDLFRFGFKCLGLYKRGFQNALDLTVEHQRWTLPHLRSPLTLLHLSDLHFIDGHPMAQHLANHLRQFSEPDARPPDATVITGDYRFPLTGDIRPAIDGLATIRPHLPEPVIAILGNHDSLDMVAPLEALDINVLVNEACRIPSHPEVLFVGVDDPSSYQTNNLTAALHHQPFDPLNTTLILLSHACNDHDEAEAAGIHLHLSGHTHGGQVCLPGGRAILHNLPVPRAMNAGRWTHRSLQGYTHRGTGTCAAEVRFHCPPEITIHSLRPGNPPV